MEFVFEFVNCYELCVYLYGCVWMCYGICVDCVWMCYGCCADCCGGAQAMEGDVATKMKESEGLAVIYKCMNMTP
jgi:hypothetical protein